MDEHFQFNNTRGPDGAQYFNDPISRVSCPKWEYEDPSTMLKTANFTPWREDWVELLEFVDVIKMHGRESVSRLFETMDIVRRYKNNEEILFNDFNEYLTDTNLKDRPIDAWRKKIKNCKFDCWDCNFCDNLYSAKSKVSADPKVLAVTEELVNSVNTDYSADVSGLTSSRVQKLIHSLAKRSSKYLEIGSAMGATTVAAASTGIETHCVDNWSQNVQPMSHEFDLPDNTKAEFLKNVRQYSNVHVHDSEMLSVDAGKITDVDLFFYDGSHDINDTIRAVKHYSPCLAKTSIIIFDDANWNGVVQGADMGLSLAKLTPIYKKLILNSTENKTQWWNGLYIVVVQKDD